MAFALQLVRETGYSPSGSTQSSKNLAPGDAGIVGAGNGKVDPTAAALGEGLAIHCSYGSRCHADSRDEAAGIVDERALLALSRAGAALGRG